MPDDDRVAATLAALLGKWGKITEAATRGPWLPAGAEVGTEWVVGPGYSGFIAEARTAMPLLLKAVEDVLKLHQPGRVTILGALCKRHENHRHFSITSTEADDVRACPDCAATVYSSCAGCGPQVSVDACPTRNAIAAALAGEGAGDEH